VKLTTYNSSNDLPKPFLRWAGGKTRSALFLKAHLPSDFSRINRYFEPFLGGGSLFFSLRPQKAVLSDNNKDLIESYRAIQKNPILTSKYLSEHRGKTSEHYYYKMRNKYNNSKPSIYRAALFIYLNKTCFNGIWRVNKRGEFNVPYGKQEHPSIPSKEELIRISEALASAEIIHCDYKDIIHRVQKGDFVYLDPPYPPLNSTSNFTQYTAEDFTKEDHKELALFSRELTRKGCHVLISNSDTEYIRSLFKDDFHIFELEVTRLIRADGHRYKVKEIAITNYEVGDNPTP
jgi:DNA adenine methylase